MTLLEEHREYLNQRLRTRIRSLEISERKGHISDAQQDTLNIYRIALAALTAEPVHQFIVNNPDNDGYAEWADCNPDYFSNEPGDMRRVLYTAPPAPVICSPAYHDEAKRLAELHGMSFVVFRRGEAPAVADPTRVFIGFTDKGLGHDTTGGQQ